MAVPAKLAPYLKEEDLEAISAAVAAAESKTSGEIRVHILYNLLPLEKPRARAIREFFRLGVRQTKGRTGVLLFFTLKKKRFEIVADEGVDACVEEGTWDRMARDIESHIQEVGLAPGIVHAVRRVGEVLENCAPKRPDDRDELSNRVTLDEKGP